MNIFFLDNCPVIAATYYNDRHCVKMILELSQIFCTNFHNQGIPAPYKSTHLNHPSTKWARQSLANFDWLLIHLEALHKEYTLRYKKTHKSSAILPFIKSNRELLKFSETGLRPFAVAINSSAECRKVPCFDSLNPVDQYRLYYKHDKKHIAQWKTNKPDWF